MPRLAATVTLLALALAPAAARSAATQTIVFRIVGSGQPIPTEIDAGPCPQGKWSAALYAASQDRRIGTVYGCGLTISKHDQAGYGLRWIHQTARQTYVLPGGTIQTIETQTFDFARDRHHSRATYRGRITGGTGTHAGARGTVAASGPALDGRANYRVALALR
ncbi:MAG: hypothetical protein ACJ757_15220 [Gaiellaceae bacterium]